MVIVCYNNHYNVSFIVEREWAIPQKMLQQGEKKKLTNKGCFPLKINKEVLTFDDEEKERRK